jgi:hypothetical protein
MTMASKSPPRRLTPAEQQGVDEVIAIVEDDRQPDSSLADTLDRIVALAREIEREKDAEYRRGCEETERHLDQARGDESDWVATRGVRS